MAREDSKTAMARVLVIDNYDSFTWNLVQALRVKGARVRVRRNDRVAVADALAMRPTHVVISPGPGRPEAAGVSLDAVRAFLGRVPLLGVCLGHQALALVLGGRVGAARSLVHGKALPIHHDGRDLFAGLPDPLDVGRYHSLAVEEDSLPAGVEVAARATDGEVMAIRCPGERAWGVQFHPESVLTPLGPMLLGAFLDVVERPLR
jgi:anthranilate synthase/aminodeoxychorismate synthase-like glutamine amidotransferase